MIGADRPAGKVLSRLLRIRSTASSLHVGSMIPSWRCAHLARGATTPSPCSGRNGHGRRSQRQDRASTNATVETIQDNRDQIDAGPPILGAAGEHALVLDNAEWLGAAQLPGVLRDIGRHFSVNRMLAAEAYRCAGKGALLHRVQLQLRAGLRLLGALSPLRMHVADWWRDSGKHLRPISFAACTRQKPMPSPFLSSPRIGRKMGKTAAGAVWLRRRDQPFRFLQYS